MRKILFQWLQAKSQSKLSLLLLFSSLHPSFTNNPRFISSLRLIQMCWIYRPEVLHLRDCLSGHTPLQYPNVKLLLIIQCAIVSLNNQENQLQNLILNLLPLLDHPTNPSVLISSHFWCNKFNSFRWCSSSNICKCRDRCKLRCRHKYRPKCRSFKCLSCHRSTFQCQQKKSGNLSKISKKIWNP